MKSGFKCVRFLCASASEPGDKYCEDHGGRAVARDPLDAIADQNPEGGDAQQAPSRSDESGGAEGNRPNPIQDGA